MRWHPCIVIYLSVTIFALGAGVAVHALPPGAERVAAVRREVAALQADLRTLVLEHLEALAFDQALFEDHLELLSEAVQDLVEQNGVYRPDQVRVLLDQAEEILDAFLFHLDRALAMLADIEARFLLLQIQLDELKNDRLLAERLHQRATRALTLAQSILLGKLLPPLMDLRILSDDLLPEDCVAGPFGEPNPDADLRDCFDDARASLADRDYEQMLDEIEAARSKLEPIFFRLVQIFFGTNLRRGPVGELLTQLKTIDRQLVSAFKRLLRRPRLASELSRSAPAHGDRGADQLLPRSPMREVVQWALFDLQGRLLLQLSDGRALSSLSADLANGVYLLVLSEQTADGQRRRSLQKIALHR